MALLRTIAAGLRSLFRRKTVIREMDEELGMFLDMAAQEKMQGGLSHDDALREVRLERGSLEIAREAVGSAGWESILETFWQDIRFGFRTLRQHPGFAGVVVTTLALGIGANTAIFSLINALILRTLPVSNPGTLVELLHQYPGEPAFNGFSLDSYKIIRDGNHVLSDLLVDSPDLFEVRGETLETHKVIGGYLSGNFFESLGPRPAIGRFIGAEADDLGHPSPVAVVSWSYWKSKYNLDPTILGKQIVVNDTPVTIIGVTEQGFAGLLSQEMSQDILLPVSMEPVVHHSSLGWGSMWLVGRLKPGISIDQARAEMAVLFDSAIQAPDVGPYVRQMKFKMELAASGISTPLRQMLRTPLLALMVIVGLVLLIACANLAGLLLARGASRRHEMAMRACLGAGRLRLVRQVLTESLMLSLFGMLLGVLIAYFGVRGILRVITSGRQVVGLPVHIDAFTHPDTHVLLFTCVIAVLTALLFGVVPAVSLSSLPAPGLQQIARIGESKSWRRFSKSLVVVQVALSTVLLSATALFVGYVSNLRDLDLGFRRDNLLLVSLDSSHSGYDSQRWSGLSQQLLAQLESLPGVRSATFSETTPMSGTGASSMALVKGHPENHREVSISFVAPNYFQTYGTPLMAGRDFSSSDQGEHLVAIINQTMARDYFGTSNPIGSYVTLDHITLRGDDTPTYEIVGIVGDAKYNDLRQPTPRTIYLSAYQEGRIVSQVTLRTDIDPEAMISAVRQTVASVMKTVPIGRVQTMTDQIDASIVPERLVAILSTWFGALGALLTAVGLYSLLAYTVARMTNEIGVRMALGAKPSDMLWMVLTDALRMVCLGLLIGIPLAFASKRLATALIDGLSVQSPIPIVVGIAALIVIALCASYLPARRASHVDPMVSLRYE